MLLFFLLLSVCFSQLKPSSKLTSNCFNFPSVNFSPKKWAKLSSFPTNQSAIDFELDSLKDGSKISLSSLVKEKPVMLQLGCFTCPIFEGNIASSLKLSNKYHNDVHFVVVYTVEAHPKLPDPSPYRGVPWVLNFSNYTQPLRLARRFFNADHVVGLGQNQLLLIDSFVPEEANNPIWCTYGPAPNAAYLIDKQGQVLVSQLWFDPNSMEQAIKNLLKKG